MRHHLATSRSPAPSQEKQITLAPGERRELCAMDGARRVVRLWFTLPLVGQSSALTDLVLRAWWDGEETPSVEVPLGAFFGASFGRPRQLISEKLVIAGGGYLCRFEMPFTRGARLELENGSGARVRDVFFQVGWTAEPERSEPVPTFHAQYRHQQTQPGGPVVLLNAAGRGRLAAVCLDIQGQDWWLKPPVRDIVLPRGFGLGLLEGWETLVVDGHELSGTGAEDYFSGGFYFRGGPFCTPTHGCTRRSFATARVSAYRLHLDDPIAFEQSLEFRLDHGLGNSMRGEYASVVSWYQAEPHAAFPPLPVPAARRPGFPGQQLAQWALCLLAGAGAAGAVLALLLR